MNKKQSANHIADLLENLTAGLCIFILLLTFGILIVELYDTTIISHQTFCNHN